jgi:hypothetical protein
VGRAAMTSAAAILAKAEAAGVRLRLNQDGSVAMEGPPPPPGLLADIRRYWDALRSVLKARRALGVAPPPGWLDATARAIHDALAAGAKQESDALGWLYITTPDGQRLTVAPDMLTEIIHAGLLLPLLQDAAEDAEARGGRCL